MSHASALLMKANAERALRRGDLKDALLFFHELHKIDPDDHSVQTRIQAIESVLQPEYSPSPEPTTIVDRPFSRSPTEEQTAEMLFDQGDLPAAIAIYTRIVQSREGHELAQERLDELKTIQALQPQTTSSSTNASGIRGFLETLLMRIASRRRV